MKTLTIEFVSQELLDNFASWLSNSGEQQWADDLYMDENEEIAESWPDLNYHKDGVWLKDNLISVTLSKKET
jgi:hypothetical protein